MRFDYKFAFYIYFQIEWDDEEERRYREWLREEQQRAGLDPAEWTDLEAEEAYRARMRQEAADRGEEPIEWEDTKEREFRNRYIQMR